MVGFRVSRVQLHRQPPTDTARPSATQPHRQTLTVQTTLHAHAKRLRAVHHKRRAWRAQNRL